jgi:hypothetical protein
VTDIMKKIIFIIAIILSGRGCIKVNPDPGNNNNSDTEITVNLIANDDPKIFSKSVILSDGIDYLIKTIFESTYKFVSPVDTRSGRRFYIEIKLLLETVDSIINF